ncbi:hypothetical protein F5146DRAFT_1041789 [Armillaria mellea]|nr:hypothetical protein F5146DRAFT_1041789 [Armillaria mellea]
MLSFPLLLLSLHALAVYSAPALNINDVLVQRQAGGTIHGLTLHREEYHQLQKRRDVQICGVPARTNYKCTERFPSTLTVTKRARTGSSRTNSTKPPGFYNEGGSSPNGKQPSEYSYHRDSSEERKDLQDDKDMEQYEKEHAKGNQCDHLVELQTVDAILDPYCQGTPGISTAIATEIRDYLNDADKNLYLVKGDVNSAKGAATGRALLRAKDRVRHPPVQVRPLTYKSRFQTPTWIEVVEYLEAKESVARTNAEWIKSTSRLTANVDTQIHGIYEDALAVAQAMSRLQPLISTSSI